ncbi:S8 family serine peptidase [Micromonospora sp. NPDC049359]|uniref:S8 family serine peptidase n=1 Tax=unclassified Micromonospora TaxID=2617518 RepID=UPI0037890507
MAVVATACCVLVAAAGAAAAQAPTPDPQAYVKFYVVAAEHQGQPENLTEISVRFLGSGERSAEIYNLNAGRVQADGAGLTDPAKLNPGWRLVLPWDAAGEGVQYGQLPPGPKPSRPGPKPSRTAPKPPVTTSPSAGPGPGASPSGPPNGSGAPSGCTATAGSSSRSNWAQLRLAADGAWDMSRGNGVMVAVVDSGVDGKLPQLNGRVAVGADVTAGNGRGDTDCLGTGTAMASIIAASASTSADKTPVGIAPDATILPIRMLGPSASSRAMDASNAIEVAVSAGASVVALGADVDLGAPTVAASITTALNHDVVVVAGAPTKPVTAPSGSERSATGALLLAGGVGADGQLAEEYQQGTVEVVAPGVEVASLGISGTGVMSNTGTRFAVAFVAGQAALVRAAYPDLTAVQVKERIRSTADAMENGDARYGAGMINPAASVAKKLDEERQVSGEQNAGGGGGTALAVLLGLGLVAAIGLVFAIRFRRRAIG